MAASAIAIAPPENLSKKGNISDNWRRWKQNFEIYLGAAGIGVKDPKACPLFLHNIGQYGRDIFNQLEISVPHDLEDFFAKFDEHCFPKKNLTLDRYTFFNTKQENQTVDKFYSLLKQRSLNCEFGELTNGLIGTQIINGINNAALRKRLLTMPEITVNDIIQECKTAEIAKLNAEKIEGISKKQSNKPPNDSSVNKLAQKLHTDLQAGDKNVKRFDKTEDKKKEKPAIITNCKFCSQTHKYGVCPSKTKDDEPPTCKQCGISHKAKCPAEGSICKKCKKSNHYTKMCTA